MHPAAADVERLLQPVEHQPAEAQPLFRVLERARAPLRPRLHRERGELRGHRVLGATERLAHLLEAHVRVVDVGLFRCELGVRHGRETVSA